MYRVASKKSGWTQGEKNAMENAIIRRVDTRRGDPAELLKEALAKLDQTEQTLFVLAIKYRRNLDWARFVAPAVDMTAEEVLSEYSRIVEQLKQNIGEDTYNRFFSQ